MSGSFTKFDWLVTFSSRSKYGTFENEYSRDSDKANIWELHVSTPYEFLVQYKSSSNQTKPHCKDTIFFYFVCEKYRKSVNHIYELQALRCIRKWHKQELPSIFNSCSHYAKNIHWQNTRYTWKDNLYMTCFGTNTGKQAISATAVDLRQELTPNFKPLRTSIFNKRVKQYLLIKQNSSSDI